MDKLQRPQHQVTIHLREDKLQAVEALREREQRTRSNMIALLVAEALEHRGVLVGASTTEPSRG